jgi:hypothetical protein
MEKKFFWHPLKVIEERSRIQIHQSEIQIRGSGSRYAPKCYGSPTLLCCMCMYCAAIESVKEVPLTFFINVKQRITLNETALRTVAIVTTFGAQIIGCEL